MNNIIKIAKFINDIMLLADTIEKNSRDHINIITLFDIYYYSISFHKLTKMDCFVLMYDTLVEICSKPVIHHRYYIFYDIIKEGFVFLKGKEIKQFKIECPKEENLIELIKQNNSFILNKLYIENKLKKIPSILNKLDYYDLETIVKIISAYYEEFKKITQTKDNKQQILLQTSYFIGNEDYRNVYQNRDKHLLISMELVVAQDNDYAFENNESLITTYTENIKKQILEIYGNSSLLDTSKYFHMYQYNMINEDNQTISHIYIDFEFDDLVKLLLFIDIMEVIDKM